MPTNKHAPKKVAINLLSMFQEANGIGFKRQFVSPLAKPKKIRFKNADTSDKAGVTLSDAAVRVVRDFMAANPIPSKTKKK